MKVYFKLTSQGAELAVLRCRRARPQPAPLLKSSGASNGFNEKSKGPRHHGAQTPNEFGRLPWIFPLDNSGLIQQ